MTSPSGSHVAIEDLFPGVPVDPSCKKARPRFEVPNPDGSQSPAISFGSETGSRETLTVQLEFFFPVEGRETMSFAGASAVHESNGYWTCIIPGSDTAVLYLGQIRSIALFEFIAVVRSAPRLSLFVSEDTENPLGPSRPAVLKSGDNQ